MILSRPRQAAGSEGRAAGKPPPSADGLALLRLGGRGLLPGLSVLPVLRARGAFAAIHAAVIVGVGAAIAVLALAAALAVHGVLAVLGVALLLGLALMLGVALLRRLGGGRGDERESRSGGKKEGLHLSFS